MTGDWCARIPVSECPARLLSAVLTRQLGDFVGRRREQRRWPAELLTTALAGIVTYGIGGVGKTTLAEELAVRVLDRDPDRVLVAVSGEISVDDLIGAVVGGLRRRLLRGSADAALTRDVELAGRVDLGWQERLGLLRERVLETVPLLVVIDNFEDNLIQTAAGRELRDPALAGLLSGWVSDPGRGRLLITSRFPFILPGSASQRLSFRALGPLSYAETLKLIWSLPALDRLDDQQAELLWRMVGGHHRSLEYLDALLSGGKGRYPDITERLAAALEHRLGPDRARQLLAGGRDLDAALAEVATLAADDVLLDQLLARLTPAVTQLLVGVSVYREPVDLNAVLFLVGAEDPAAASVPDREAAAKNIQRLLQDAGLDPAQLPDLAGLPVELSAQLAALVAELDRQPTPPLRAAADLLDLVDAAGQSSLLSVERQPESTVFVHRWTAGALEHRLLDDGRHEQLLEAHRRAARYWQWRDQVWPQDRHADIHDLIEARYHHLQARDVEAADTTTERICSQLHSWGAWDHEAALVNATLNRLEPASPDTAKWHGQLGNIAQARGNYDEAARRYQQAGGTLTEGITSAPRPSLPRPPHVPGRLKSPKTKGKRGTERPGTPRKSKNPTTTGLTPAPAHVPHLPAPCLTEPQATTSGVS